MQSARALPVLLVLSGWLVLNAAAAGAQPEHQHSGDPARLGNVHFPISCGAEAQQAFDRAAAMLHSFWYEQAVRAFTGLSETSPECAIAFWGVAMSEWHPLWEQPDAASLARGRQAIETARRARTADARERRYVAALGAFYDDLETVDHATRAKAYETAMRDLVAEHPNDGEAAIFYALALLTTAVPTDKTYANQKRAGELLERTFAAQPDHPGVAHYIIHAYDSPPLANRALTAARRYAEIAPAVPHALHMPSHIFVRVGSWQEVIDSNIASASAAQGHTTAGAAAFEALHSWDYLTYAYLQQARDEEAQAVVEQVRGFERAEPPNFAAGYALAAIPARYTLERRRWAEAARLTPQPAAFPWAQFPWAAAVVHFARGVGAARSGDLETARASAGELQSIHDALVRQNVTYWPDQVEIQRLAVAAWLAHGEGNQAEALRTMRAAADLEDATEKHPVTPGPIVPARELLGDLLLEVGQYREAFEAYRTALEAAPRRFGSLYGAARSAELGGDTVQARTFYQKLREVARQSSDRPELQRAEAFLATNQ